MLGRGFRILSFLMREERSHIIQIENREIGYVAVSAELQNRIRYVLSDIKNHVVQ
jgi:hypothetical protein